LVDGPRHGPRLIRCQWSSLRSIDCPWRSLRLIESLRLGYRLVDSLGRSHRHSLRADPRDVHRQAPAEPSLRTRRTGESRAWIGLLAHPVPDHTRG
jgi:hypothetical protein